MQKLHTRLDLLQQEHFAAREALRGSRTRTGDSPPHDFSRPNLSSITSSPPDPPRFSAETLERTARRKDEQREFRESR